jgi:hypothetical protein
MKGILTIILKILPAFCVFLCQPGWANSNLEVKPLYTLSNFSGPIPYDHVRLAVDRVNGEVLVLDRRDADIRVYNSSGMEVYHTTPYWDLGAPMDLAVGDTGSIDLLLMDGGHFTIHRCNYRGEPISEFFLTGTPPDLGQMRPDRILWENGLLYLVDPGWLKVAVFDGDGRYLRVYRMEELLGLQGSLADESTMFGFTVDNKGNMFFTIPVDFSAYRVSPDGEVARFGESGSSPGQFAVVSGIAVDGTGNIFLTDRRRSVVLVYGADLGFLYEFGYRGYGPGNLFVPGDLVLGPGGKLYVTQMRKRGVQVYRVILADDNADNNFKN